MKIKDLMIPIADYQTLGSEATLKDVVAALKGGKHRDILITDAKGDFAGILTMTDVIMALEPNYKKLSRKELDTDILSSRFVSDIFKEFNLWSSTLTTLCETGTGLKVTDVMHVPDEKNYLNEDADLEHGVHMYIMGAPQPLVVRSNGTVTGILRMSDVFDEIINRMNTCALDS